MKGGLNSFASEMYRTFLFASIVISPKWKGMRGKEGKTIKKCGKNIHYVSRHDKWGIYQWRLGEEKKKTTFRMNAIS